MLKNFALPIVCSILASVMLYCGSEKVEVNAQKSTEPSGKELAEAMCASCHLVPDPSDLDKTSWEKYILPRMGHFLGIYSDTVTRQSLIESGPAEAKVLAANVYPEGRLIDSTSWEKIKHYYMSNAPENPIETEQLAITEGGQFKAVRPAFGLTPPSTTMLTYNEKSGLTFLGDAFTGGLYVLDQSLRKIGQAALGESPVWISESKEYVYVTVMGSFSPTDAPNGKLVRLRKDGAGTTETLISDLQRPVHHSMADFDGDGLEDIVVCEFAKWTGSLSWWRNNGKGGYERNVLRNEPGSMKAYPRDWNGDGNMDIVAMFGQGNEGIWAFINDGAGNFTEQAIVRFPPSYGSSFFSLEDLNGDGNEDMIYCAGDNADFPPILKHYHGVYIYLNQGNQSFDEPIFIRLNGAYGVEANDFDGDGDIDFTAISFFPDFAARPQEAFVFLENDGNWNFTATTFPEVSSGRWIVMERGDVDNDGDQDIFLGSLAFEVPGRDDLVNQWAQSGISFILLENVGKKKGSQKLP